MTKMKNIVVMAHNRKKPELIAFLKERQDWFWGRVLIATGRSAEFLESENFKIPIQHLSPGKSGGYNQITEMIKNKEVDLVFFFQDHEVRDEFHRDIRLLIEAWNAENIPLATNPASAELLIIGLIRKELALKNQQSK